MRKNELAGCVLALVLTGGVASAQETTTPPPAEADAPPEVPGPVTTAAETGAPPAVVAEVEAATPVVTDDATKKPLSASAWGRISNIFQGQDPEKLDDVRQEVEVNLLLGGSIHKNVAWTANFVAVYGPTQVLDEMGNPTGAMGGEITGSVDILDLIGQFKFTDELNVWVGKMLVPSDRSNFSGAWFMAPWAYPGFYLPFSAPAGPRQGPFGRNNGVTVWGETGGGLFKYYAGAFDLFDQSQSPLVSTRVNLSLLNPEPGYYNSSSYYGKDILAVGLSGQYKKDGSLGAMGTTPDDYTGFSADVLYEKDLGKSGVLDVEGAFYAFFGDNEPLDNHFWAMASYLIPTEIGIGKLQPLVRFQGASPADGSDMWSIVDVQAGYIIAPYAARVALLYQRTDAADVVSNAVIIGVQLQK